MRASKEVSDTEGEPAAVELDANVSQRKRNDAPAPSTISRASRRLAYLHVPFSRPSTYAQMSSPEVQIDHEDLRLRLLLHRGTTDGYALVVNAARSCR